MYTTLIQWLIAVVAAVLTALYGLILTIVFCYQDVFVYPGQLIPLRGPAPQGEVLVEKFALRDGRRFRVCVAAPAQPKAVVAWFVGNAGGFARCRYTADTMSRAEGFKIYSPVYPGYDKGTGRPSKAACLECAEVTAARARAEAKRLGVPLLVAGHSLGTFMACHAASLGYGDRLFLLSPPSSIRERGEALLPFLPVRCLLREDLDNLRAAPRIRVPTLVVHAADDPIVPLSEGRKVVAAIRDAKLVVVPGASHMPTSLMRDSADAVREFLHGK